MCFVLYMASDKRRREIPWDERTPAFHVSAEHTDAQKVRVHFSKPDVYYLGSSSYCGCDFPRAPLWTYEKADDAEKQDVQENQARLHAYLKECLVDEDCVELFGCWSGNEGQPVESERTIRVDDLVSDEFFFDENRPELIVVVK